jgi:hypothetical protein
MFAPPEKKPPVTEFPGLHTEAVPTLGFVD